MTNFNYNIRGITLSRFIVYELFIVLLSHVIFIKNILFFLFLAIVLTYLNGLFNLKQYIVTSDKFVIKYPFRIWGRYIIWDFQDLKTVVYKYENATYAEPRIIFETGKMKHKEIIIYSFKKVRDIMKIFEQAGVQIQFKTTEKVLKKQIKWSSS